MKILAAGDLHGDVIQARALAKQAKKEDVDLVVLSGDITMAESSTKGLIGPFKKAGKKVVIIPGNHESVATTDFLVDLYGVGSLHGYSIIIGDVGVFGCGSANIGIFQLSEEEIYSLLKKGFEKIKNAKKKVMVTHIHPEGSLMSKVTPWRGSMAVMNAIKKFKPDISIFSHVHEAEGLEQVLGKTKLMSVGKQGKIIEI